MICVIFSFSDVLLVLIFLSTHHAGELAFQRKEKNVFTTADFEILDTNIETYIMSLKYYNQVVLQELYCNTV